MQKLIQLAIGFVVLGVIFWPIERMFPSIRGKKIFRRGFRVDLIYWFFTPTITAAFSYGVTVLTAISIIVTSGGEISGANLSSGRSPITNLPLFLQYAIALFAADFMGYVAHRLFHHGKLWDFHAIHHASEELDWLSSVRLHPVNQAVGQIIVIAPLALLGFNLQILGTTAGLLTFWAIFVHSNVCWTFGALRSVIATPAFHRWHQRGRGARQEFRWPLSLLGPSVRDALPTRGTTSRAFRPLRRRNTKLFLSPARLAVPAQADRF